jgi:putative endonuclease
VSGEEKPGNRSVGERGEAIAEAYLRGQKFIILEKNYRGKTGEIDIVA